MLKIGTRTRHPTNFEPMITLLISNKTFICSCFSDFSDNEKGAELLLENRANIHNKNNNGKEPRDVAVERSIVFPCCIIIQSAHVQNKSAFFFQDFPKLVKLLDTVDKYWNPWKGKHQNCSFSSFLNLRHFFHLENSMSDLFKASR